MRAWLSASLALALASCRTPSAAPTDAATKNEPSADAAAEDAAFTSAAAALEPQVVDAGVLRPVEGLPSAGKSFTIPAGNFPSGSTPGDEGRDPTTEPALVDVALGPFAIDALPFPNDPGVLPRTGVSVEEAVRLCRDHGARLCSELEWERACKGPDNDAFASGSRWNPACEKEPARCASGFGVRALGAAPELTDSRFAVESGDGPLVLRGGGHRCASRTRAAASSVNAVFRCCKGAANAARIGAAEVRPAFKKLPLDPAQLAKIFAQVPELLRIGKEVRFYNEGDIRAMTTHDRATHEGITFTTNPILWSPEGGAELLVATGRGKSMSFVVALWTLPGERYRFASAFLMLNDLSPVALAYEPAHRRELHWTSCWGCPGEQGTVSYRPEDHRAVIVQQ